MDQADILHRFTYHPSKGDQEQRYQHLRGLFAAMAKKINENCPDSREKSLAITKLEESSMWANASIARNE